MTPRTLRASSVTGELIRLALSAAVAVVVMLLFGQHSAGYSTADNVFLTIGLVTREALHVLENQLTFTLLVNRQFDDKFAVDGAKVGQQITIRKPPRYLGAEGDVLVIEDSVEEFTILKLDTLLQQGLNFSDRDLTLSIDNFSDRFLVPAVATMANRADLKGLSLYKQVANTVIEAAANISIDPVTSTTYLTSGAILDEMAAPRDGKRSLCINPAQQVAIVAALQGLFQQAEAIGRQYISGHMQKALGYDWYMDQNVRAHTVGALGGVPLVNGAGQTGDTIIIDGAGGAVVGYFKEGDVITLAGVNSVNPQNRDSTGRLQNFVVTADCDADAGGNLTVPIYPPIIVAGAQKTVTGSPADNAIIKCFGHASAMAGKVCAQALAFHEDAFTMAGADLYVPNNQDMAGRVSDDQIGMSVRLVRAFDIYHNARPTRLDSLIGWAALRPELAVRIIGAAS